MNEIRYSTYDLTLQQHVLQQIRQLLNHQHLQTIKDLIQQHKIRQYLKKKNKKKKNCKNIIIFSMKSA